MYMYMHVYMCTCVYVYMHIYIHVYIYMCVNIYISVIFPCKGDFHRLIPCYKFEKRKNDPPDAEALEALRRFM